MITKIKAWEGTPVGSIPFNSYVDYIAKMSISALDSFVPSTFIGGSSNNNPISFTGSAPFDLVRANTVLPSSLFGRHGVDRELFVIPFNKESITNYWEILLTSADNISLASGTSPVATSIIFSNTGVNTSNEIRKLPYKLNGENGTSSNYIVTVDGVIQSNYTYVFTAPNSDISFSKVNYGSQLPKLTDEDGKLIKIASNSHLTGFTLAQLNSLSGNIQFPHTMLNIGEYSHIVLRAVTPTGRIKEYFYLEPEFDYEIPLSSNKYRVSDKTNSKIEINLDVASILTDCYGSAAPTGNLFQIISAEALLEEVSGFVTNYSSKYGNVYDGDTANVVLYKFQYVGNVPTLTPIPSLSYTNVAGQNIYSSSVAASENSVILAFAYNGRPYVDLDYLKIKYIPTTVGIYYSPMDASVTTPRLIFEKNYGSFYNASVIEEADSRYNPVHRTEKLLYKIVEAGTFNPLTPTVSTPEFNLPNNVGIDAATLSGYLASDFVLKNSVPNQTITSPITVSGAFTVAATFLATFNGGLSATTGTFSSTLNTSSILNSGNINTNTLNAVGNISSLANISASSTLFGNIADIFTSYRIQGSVVLNKSSASTLKINDGGATTDTVETKGQIYENTTSSVRVYSPNNPPPAVLPRLQSSSLYIEPANLGFVTSTVTFLARHKLFSGLSAINLSNYEYIKIKLINAGVYQSDSGTYAATAHIGFGDYLGTTKYATDFAQTSSIFTPLSSPVDIVANTPNLVVGNSVACTYYDDVRLVNMSYGNASDDRDYSYITGEGYIRLSDFSPAIFSLSSPALYTWFSINNTQVDADTYHEVGYTTSSTFPSRNTNATKDFKITREMRWSFELIPFGGVL